MLCPPPVDLRAPRDEGLAGRNPGSRPTRAADGKMPRRRRSPRQLTELHPTAHSPRRGGPGLPHAADKPPERHFSGLSTGFRRDRSSSRSMRSLPSRPPQPIGPS